MNGQLTENTEDIAAALHAGRKVRHHGPYRILIGNEALNFEPRTIADPVPTGAQILDAAGITNPVEYIAYRIRLCCINSAGRSLVAALQSGRHREDLEQLVDETDPVLNMRLAGEAVASTDHTHHLKSFYRGGGCLHRLKASCGTNDSLEGTMICLNDVVQIFAGPMLGRA